MSDRPADLPDFTDPPVTEVVLGVQFNSIEHFLAPHVGLLWQALTPDFPYAEEHPPVGPAFETFGENPQIVSGLEFGLPAIFGMPRSFFINRDRTPAPSGAARPVSP